MMTVDVKTREDMPLFQRLELEDDSQPSKDQRHLTKRVARLIMRGTLLIGGHPLSLDVLVNLAHALGSMDGWTWGWMDWWMGGQMDGRMDGWTDGQGSRGTP
mmetsp:Transcript_52153/g.93018  ORF Transcript_52153/g.93018 Transcript_52153/m.93018 type:complete len:102 (-) Transcript_52153:1-306(-)